MLKAARSTVAGNVGGNKFKQHNYSGGGKTEDKLELRQPPKKKEMRRLNAKKKNKTCPS